MAKLPYRQSQIFNAFDQLTDRNSTLWSMTGCDFSNGFRNNRSTSGTYDHNGNLTEDEEIEFEYDASGGMLKTWRDLRYETLLSRDGEGREVKRGTREWDEPDDEEGDWQTWKAIYFIYSSVFGRNITEASETGKKRKTYVVAGGGVLATHTNIDTGVASVARCVTGMPRRSAL